jgi:hypothetical protein
MDRSHKEMGFPHKEVVRPHKGVDDRRSKELGREKNRPRVKNV